MALSIVRVEARRQGGIQRSVRRGTAVWARVFGGTVLFLLFLLLSGCADEEGDERHPPLSTAAPPVARVTFPGPAALFTTSNATIRGTAQSQNAITQITVNGVQATSTDGFATWVARVTLPPGTHTVVVSTEDVLGNRDAAAATASVVVGALLREPRGLAVEASGQLVVVDSVLRAVVRIDPGTGASSMVSDMTSCPATPFGQPVDIAIEANGDLVVADRWVGVIRVDPVSGSCSVVSGGGMDEEPPSDGVDSIVVEADGQLVVSRGGLVRVDPGSGNRTVLSDPFTMGSEPLFMPHDLLIDPLGQFVVTNPIPIPFFASVVQVDPHSGHRTVVSGGRIIVSGGRIVDESTIGSGPALLRPAGIALEASGQFVVVDSLRRAVFRVDPVSGNRTIIADDARGSGPLFEVPEGIVVAASGQLLVTDSARGTVLRVDPESGNRTVLLAEAGLGRGPALATPTGIAVEANGDLVVAEGFDQRTQEGLQAVVRVNPMTGDRTIVSDRQTGEGPSFLAPEGIAVEGNGQLVLVDAPRGAVLRVDPGNGTRTVLADAVTGSGPFVARPSDVAVEASGDLVVVGSTLSFGDLFGAVIHVDPISGVRTRVDRIRQGRGLVAPKSIARDLRDQWIVLDVEHIIRLDPVTGLSTTVSVITHSPTAIGFPNPIDLVVEASGHILLVDQGLKAVVRIDPVTGERTMMSDATTGSGPAFVTPFSLAIEANGQVVVTDSGLRAVLRIDAQSGDRAIISQ